MCSCGEAEEVGVSSSSASAVQRSEWGALNGNSILVDACDEIERLNVCKNAIVGDRPSPGTPAVVSSWNNKHRHCSSQNNCKLYFLNSWFYLLKRKISLKSTP